MSADVLFGEGGARRGQHKDRMLCRQAEEALSEALASLGDEVLEDAFVAAVLPAPDASRLEVVVEVPGDVDLDEVLDCLDKRSGFLRAQVAEAITRKRAPTLVFRVVPREVGS